MNKKKRQQKKLKRRVKRKKDNKAKKELDKEVESVNNSITMFQRRPNECSACDKPFPEKDREAHMTWQVVVRNEQETVRLFCPECQEKVKTRVTEIDNEV